jgi:hypothetical protein
LEVWYCTRGPTSYLTRLSGLSRDAKFSLSSTSVRFRPSASKGSSAVDNGTSLYRKLRSRIWESIRIHHVMTMTAARTARTRLNGRRGPAGKSIVLVLALVLLITTNPRLTSKIWLAFDSHLWGSSSDATVNSASACNAHCHRTGYPHIFPAR